MTAPAPEAPSKAPVPKITAAGTAGLAAVALVWYVRTLFGVDMPAEVAAATVLGIAVAAGYLKSNAPFRIPFARNDSKGGRHAGDG